MTLTFLQGDAATQLRALPDASVHLCITSPPYHGQRRYHAGPQEIGSEPTWAEHLEALLAVFDEVHRVLRPDGVLWVNYGDKYAGGGNGGGGSFASDLPGRTPEPGTDKNKRFGQPNGLGLPDKNLLGLPFRLVMALQERGMADAKAAKAISATMQAIVDYYAQEALPLPDRLMVKLEALRTEWVQAKGKSWFWRAYCPWPKRNGLPSSAPDRPGMNLEHLFMLTKSPRYFYDPEAVRLSYAASTLSDKRDNDNGHRADRDFPGSPSNGGTNLGGNRHPGRARRMGDWWVDEMRAIVGPDPDLDLGELVGFAEALIDQYADNDAPAPSALRALLGRLRERVKHPQGGLALAPDGTPLGLYLATEGFNGKRFAPAGADPDAAVDHYATFPTGLVEPLILSGTSAKGCCPACAAPWVRVVEKEDPEGRLGKAYHDHAADETRGNRGVPPAEGAPIAQTTGWRPTCECTVTPPFGPGEMQAMPLPPVPCTVLDPFLGAGTTLLVAERLGRHGVGIELNPDYLAMARRRIETDDAARVARLERAQGTLLEVEA